MVEASVGLLIAAKNNPNIKIDNRTTTALEVTAAHKFSPDEECIISDTINKCLSDYSDRVGKGEIESNFYIPKTFLTKFFFKNNPLKAEGIDKFFSYTN